MKIPVIMRPNECDTKAFKNFNTFIPDNATFLEIGCYAGESSINFLQSNKIEKYYAIDLWDSLGKKDTTNQANLYDMDLVEKWFDERIKPYHNIVKKFKMRAEDAYKFIPNNSIDVLYIDANHDYQYVKKDIMFSIPKLKNKAIIAGHDYYMEGVTKAVKEIFKKEPDNILEDGSWVYFWNNEYKKFGLLTFHINQVDDYDGYATQTKLEKNEYCKLHSYTHYHFDNFKFQYRWSPEWGKIVHMLDVLPKHDWVFWSDADTMITNFTIKLETLIDENYNFIVSKDINGMNTGNFLIKNTPWSIDMLKAIIVLKANHENRKNKDIYDIPQSYKDLISKVAYKNLNPGQYTEQDAINDLLTINYNDTTKYIKFIDKRLINSYQCQNPPGINDWQKGDFVLHAPATPSQIRIKAFNYFRQFVVK